MTGYGSTDDLLAAARALFARLESGGHTEAAGELRAGFSCLNGLTDGWALFLESIDRVARTRARQFGREDQQAIGDLRQAVRSIVHRR